MKSKLILAQQIYAQHFDVMSRCKAMYALRYLVV